MHQMHQMIPEEAYHKASALGKRIPELEGILIKDACFSYRYAFFVIEGIFILGEPAICKDALYSYWYAKDVIKGRFISGEAVISKNARYSYWYAKYVIKGRLPDFMHNQMILENNRYTKDYVNFIQ